MRKQPLRQNFFINNQNNGRMRIPMQFSQKNSISSSLFLNTCNMNKQMHLRDHMNQYSRSKSVKYYNQLPKRYLSSQMLQADQKLKQNYNLSFQKSLGILIRDISELKDKIQLFTLRKSQNQIKKFVNKQNTKSFSKKQQKSKSLKNCMKTIFQSVTPPKIDKKYIQTNQKQYNLHKSCNLSAKKTRNNIKNNQFFSLTAQKGQINKSNSIEYKKNCNNYSRNIQNQEAYFSKPHNCQDFNIQLLQNYNKKLFLHNKFLERQIKFQNKQKLKQQKNNSQLKNTDKYIQKQTSNMKQHQSRVVSSKIKKKLDNLTKLPLPQNLPNKRYYKQKNRSVPKYQQQITLKFSELSSSQDVSSNKILKQHMDNSLDQSLLLDCLAIQCNEQMILKQKGQQNKLKKIKAQQSLNKNKKSFICNKENQYQEKKIQPEQSQKSSFKNGLQQNKKYAIKTPQLKQSNKDVLKLQERLQSLTVLLRLQEQKQKLTKIKMRQQISEIAHQLNMKKGYSIEKTKIQSPSNPRWLL